MNDKVTISLFELASKYPTDDSARIFLEEQRWHGQPVCPYCGSKSQQHKHYHKGESGYYHCHKCNKVYTVRTGTIFERSHIGLAKWLFALYYILTARKGVSSLQLSKHLGITQKSTWFMLQRIRTAMSAGSIKLSGTVEIDEAYIGGKESNKHDSRKLNQGRGSVPAIFRRRGHCPTSVVNLSGRKGPSKGTHLAFPGLRKILADGFCRTKASSAERIEGSDGSYSR